MGRQRGVVVLGVALATAVAPGCGEPALPGVRFQGRTLPALVAPERVREVSVRPAGYQVLGSAAVECRLTASKKTLSGARLSDVDCSEHRLRQALREQAAAVGGEILTDVECVTHRYRRGTEERLRASCAADVARPGRAILARRPLVPEQGAGASAIRGADRDEAGSAEGVAAAEAWRIRVDFTPSGAGFHLPARHVRQVREVPVIPASHLAVGDVLTRCDRDCSERGAREGLLVVAGRMGATDVAAVRCVARGAGFVCTGTAAATLNPAADAL